MQPQGGRRLSAQVPTWRTAVASTCTGLLCGFRSVKHRAFSAAWTLPSPIEDGEKAFPRSSHPVLSLPHTISVLASPNQVCTPPVTGSSLPREARFQSADAPLQEEASSL